MFLFLEIKSFLVKCNKTSLYKESRGFGMKEEKQWAQTRAGRGLSSETAA